MLVVSAILWGTGCNDDNTPSDEDKPTITSVNFLDGTSIQAGGSLNVRITFSDNMELSEAFVEVHDNFEGHKHGKANLKYDGSQILSLSGTSADQTANLLVPNNAAAGPYHLEISVLNAEGNRSDVKVLDFEITQLGQPTYTNLVEAMEVKAGEEFTITFTVEDDVDLAEVSYKLIDHENESAAPISDGDIDLEGSSDLSFTFDQKFTIDNSVQEAELIISTFDSDGNLSITEVEIDVK